MQRVVWSTKTGVFAVHTLMNLCSFTSRVLKFQIALGN